MARSRKRKSKMSSKRLDAVKKIEGRGKSGEKKSSGTGPYPFGKRIEAAGKAYAADRQEIEDARAMGLSVPVDATAGQLHRQLEEFELAKAYIGDVWEHLSGRSAEDCGVDKQEFNRFVASLLSDGRLAVRIAKAQGNRGESQKLSRGGTYRRVCHHLYSRFGDCLPKRSLWQKLLG